MRKVAAGINRVEEDNHDTAALRVPSVYVQHLCILEKLLGCSVRATEGGSNAAKG